MVRFHNATLLKQALHYLKSSIQRSDAEYPTNRSTRINSGFTLIELVVVIAILGILSAIALPKFVDLGSEARVAKLEAARGSVASAVSMTNAASITRGLQANDSVVLAGATVTMLYRYPTADIAGIASAAGLSSADYQFSAGGPADPPHTLVVSVIGARDATQCLFRYASPIVQDGNVWISNLVVAGC